MKQRNKPPGKALQAFEQTRQANTGQGEDPAGEKPGDDETVDAEFCEAV